MADLLRLDALIVLGALVQMLLILRARNFYLKDWLFPVFGLVGGTLFWFLFIRLVSGTQGWGPAIDGFMIGFAMSLCAGAIYLSAFAPLQLNSTTLLSLTLSFWAVYASGGVERKWLWAAVPLTLASVVFISGGGRRVIPFRAVLQAWALAAATLVAYDAIPSSIGKIVWDYRAAELAPGFKPIEALVTGAQALLLTQMGVGLLLFIFPDTWGGWLPKNGRDESIPKHGIVALIVQAAIFVWLRKSGGQGESQFTVLSVFAALAHGAMTGDDAQSRPVVDFELGERS